MDVPIEIEREMLIVRTGSGGERQENCAGDRCAVAQLGQGIHYETGHPSHDNALDEPEVNDRRDMHRSSPERELIDLPGGFLLLRQVGNRNSIDLNPRGSSISGTFELSQGK